MRGIIKLTRLVRMSEGYARDISGLFGGRFTLPLDVAPVFLPVSAMGPMTVFGGPTHRWEEGMAEAEAGTQAFTQVEWGCLGTAGVIFVLEPPELIAERMVKASRDG